MGRSLDLWGK
jgi:hypothetical protein